MTITDIEIDSEQTASEVESRLKPKVGRIPANLRLLNEQETEEDVVWTGSARKNETQFMFFLVTLFVVVNVTLVFLLSYKSKSTQQQPVPAVASVPETIKTPASALVPVTLTPAPSASVKKDLPPPPPPPATTETPAIAATPSVAAPVPVSESYITPVSPETSKATPAPFHPVTVTDHHAPVPTAPATPELKVIQSHNIAPKALSELSPAAASPIIEQAAPAPAATPATPTQDLLSVISKD